MLSRILVIPRQNQKNVFFSFFLISKFRMKHYWLMGIVIWWRVCYSFWRVSQSPVHSSFHVTTRETDPNQKI